MDQWMSWMSSVDGWNPYPARTQSAQNNKCLLDLHDLADFLVFYYCHDQECIVVSWSTLFINEL
ncbi:hypothetical protein EON65_49620 [archaeon]|nr:MAG: hypothetical protein EON65_49620 [archaeon]